jgi:hypothetical protein
MASRVLREVTKYKRSQLAHRRKTFEERKLALLAKSKHSNDPILTLIRGLKKLGLKSTTVAKQYGGSSLINTLLMHHQSEFDASIPAPLPTQWKADLETLLDIQSNRYEYADLFSRLVMEWIDNPNYANLLLHATLGGDNVALSDSESSSSKSFDLTQLGREDMYVQRKQWDSLVFAERKTDTAAIEKYLTALFIEPHKKMKVRDTPFETLRKSWESEMHVKRLSCDNAGVAQAIKAVLTADLLSGSKRDELIALQSAGVGVLGELAHVINMELASLGDWSWKPSPTPAHMRKQINGKYRVYMDPEIHQILLLQWIGTHFAVSTKRIFKSFLCSNAWRTFTSSPIKALDRDRAKFFFWRCESQIEYSLNHTRREQFKDDFFLTQLPETLEEGNRDYNPDDGKLDDDESDKKTPLEVKQTLLRLATTELMLQRKIYGSFTLCQTDFKWFGPSLPHNTIFTVLKFLGVEDSWIEFFEKFLSMSLFFPQDGPHAEARRRRCGVPISQALSTMFGETVLACLDFAVSKATFGRCQLYRLHDDVWFWGQKEDCEKAWDTIKQFTAVMGLTLNDDKTGSFHVSDRGEKPSMSLPKGPVRWGFLVLDPIEARWVVDMKNVDQHIAEMRIQFAKCRSIFSYVQAWNSYMGRFLGNNFAHPANCLGTEHLMAVLGTFKYIQKKVFMDEKNKDGCEDVTSYLKTIIQQRFGTKNIANAFLYWPVECGGLELRNPFIPLMSVLKSSIEKPYEVLQAAFEAEEDNYEVAKLVFEGHKSAGFISQVPEGCDLDKFPSLEEFTRYPEHTSRTLKEAYEKLLKSPSVVGLEETRAVEFALHFLPHEYCGSQKIKTAFDSMDVYWRWTVQLYAAEAMERFGALGLSETEMLPVELVNLLRSERVRWQG